MSGARISDKKRSAVPEIHIESKSIYLSLEAQELIRHTSLHIIRNSMDHGIETVQERLAAGKPPKDRIEVSLSLEDGNLTIIYHDDGRGLNLRAIRRIAQHRELIRADQTANLEDIAYLIFEPSFSTAEA